MEYTLEDEVRMLPRPISFECKVDDQILIATVYATISHPIHPAYKVMFSDGYEDDFYMIEEAGAVGLKQKESARYGKAVTDDLHSFYSLIPGEAIGHFKWLIDGKSDNIWITEKNIFNKQLFGAKYKGSILCCLEGKKGDWKLKPGAFRDPMATDDLIAYIGLFIDVELNP
jgi:hypothetical protein